MVIGRGNTAVRPGRYLPFSQFNMGFVLSQYGKANVTQYVSKQLLHFVTSIISIHIYC